MQQYRSNFSFCLTNLILSLYLFQENESKINSPYSLKTPMIRSLFCSYIYICWLCLKNKLLLNLNDYDLCIPIEKSLQSIKLSVFFTLYVILGPICRNLSIPSHAKLFLSVTAGLIGLGYFLNEFFEPSISLYPAHPIQSNQISIYFSKISRWKMKRKNPV